MVTETVEPEPEVSRGTYAALLRKGETPEEALVRLEATPSYAKVIGSDAGQALLAAATHQVAAIPNGGVKRKSKAAETAEVLATIEDAIDGVLEDLGIPIELQIAVAAGEAEEDIAAWQIEEASVAETHDALIGNGPLRAAPLAMLMKIAQIETASNVRDDLGDLEELAASIREHGVIQPIVVTAVYGRGLDEKATGFRVLDGHRRLGAAGLAGLEEIPVVVDQRLELGEDNAGRRITQLVANVQRTDLTAIEQAHGIATILEARPALTHGDIAKWVGKDRTWVTNALRLLETAPEVQAAVTAGTITATHARAIAGVDIDLQTKLLEDAVERGLSAKATELQAQAVKNDAKRIRDHQAGIDRRATEAIAMLEKVANREKATICVEDYYTGTDVRKALDANGWRTTNGGGVAVVKESGECGCAGVWKLAIPYNDQGHVTLHPGCNSSEHAKARQAKVDAEWKAGVERGNAERRAVRDAAEAAAARVRGAVVDILAEQPPTPLARRLTLYALLEGEVDDVLADEYLPDAAEREKLFDDDDAPWSLLSKIPDADLAGVHARAIVDFVGGYSAGPGIQAAIDAWMEANGRGEVAEPVTLVWRALRKSPGGGYSPAHLFPAPFAQVGGRDGQKVLAACGFDWTDNVKNGYFDTVIDPATSPIKAVQRRCRKCDTAGNGTLEAAATAADDDEDLRPTGEVNVDALRGEVERSLVE